MAKRSKAKSGYVLGATASLVMASGLVAAAGSASDKIAAGIGALGTLRRTIAKSFPNKPRYLLTFEHAAPLRNPTRADIEDAVDQMEVGGEGFVVLERSDSRNSFIQAARDSRNKYDFEYSTYIADSAYKLNIFECKGMAEARTVRVAMTDYARGGRSWIHTCSWTRVKL
jgi:hypothetical protein